jgi:hypothetical protein
MISGWDFRLLDAIIGFNQILTAGISITAFSLFIYTLSFNLRDRVSRSFAIILVCIVIIASSEAIESTVQTVNMVDLFLHLQWVGLVFLPPAYFHLSDALLITSGRPSRGRRRFMVWAFYSASLFFLVLLTNGSLVGKLQPDSLPAAHFDRTIWTNVFTLYYLTIIGLSEFNYIRAYFRMMTSSGRRRMLYLLSGATVIALGSYPYLLYGSGFASQYQMVFWSFALLNNVVVGALIVVMAYSVAFFGISWPDRVIKSRLVKWILRGPVTASFALASLTLVRRGGEFFGVTYNVLAPVSMVATVVIIEHIITLLAPYWERALFFGRDKPELSLFQNFEERFLTQSDINQFLDAILAAIQDLLQSSAAFIAILESSAIVDVIHSGKPFFENELLIEKVAEFENEDGTYFTVNDSLLIPLRKKHEDADKITPESSVIGILGINKINLETLDTGQLEGLEILIDRAALALEDRGLQQNIIQIIQKIEPQVQLIQQIRASSRYDKTRLLIEKTNGDEDIVEIVREALNHYWGGPKLTSSPLTKLKIIQETARKDFEGNIPNALRAVLKKAVEQIKPEGDRRFTTEWILYNILELKFFEGRKVREVANRLAMSEADLYRKQRVAVESVAKAILEMEEQVSEETN